MKKTAFAIVFFTVCLMYSCGDNKEWYEGVLNPTVSIAEIRALYENGDVMLSKTNMSGGVQTCGVVYSNHTGGNLPKGTVIMQNTRRSKTSGIAIYVGDVASSLRQGDSIMVKVEGKTLTKENGILTIKTVAESDITILSRGHYIMPVSVQASALLADPEQYESLLVKVSNCSPKNSTVAGDTYEGDVEVTDGTGVVTIHTEAGSVNSSREVSENPSTYIGLVFSEQDVSGECNMVSIWPQSTRDIMERYIILAWDLRGYDIDDGDTRNATINHDDLGISALSRGPGITIAQASNAFSATWPMDADKNAAIARGSYYEFSIIPENNVAVSLCSIDITLRVQPNGPQNYIWTYSLDGGDTFVEMSNNLKFQGKTNNNEGEIQPTLNLEDLIGVQNFRDTMIVRIYAWGAADNKSTFRIGKSREDRPYALSIEGYIQKEQLL